MKSHSVDRIPAVARLSEIVNNPNKGIPPIVIRDIKYVLEGAEKLDQEVKLKSTQIATITKQKSDLQQLVTTKTSEVQSKNSLLVQKDSQLNQFQQTITIKDSELQTKSQLLTQTVSKVKKVTRKLAQEAQSKNQLFIQKEAEKEQLRIEKEQELKSLNDTFTTTISTKEEELKSLNDNFTTVVRRAKKTNKKLAQAKSENLTKDQLILQKELEQEELRVQKESEVRNKSAEKNRIIEELASNLSTRDEEILTKSQLLSQTSHKVKKVSRKLAAKDKLISDKDQEIETLKALLAQKEAEKAELIVQKELEKQELLAQKDEEVDNKSFIKNFTINSLLEELIAKYTENNNLKIVNLLKQIEIEENEELISQKNNELLIKDLLIEFQQDEAELREEAIADLKLLNQQLSHVDLGIQINGNEVSTQVNEIDLAGHHLESQSDSFQLI